MNVLDSINNSIFQNMNVLEFIDNVMISPLPTRRNGLLGADLTCET